MSETNLRPCTPPRPPGKSVILYVYTKTSIFCLPPRLMVFCCAVYELNEEATPKLLNNSVKCFTTSPGSGPTAQVYVLFDLMYFCETRLP